MPLLDPQYLPEYLQQLDVPLQDRLDALTERENGGEHELMRLYESAVYSSQIEGSKVTLNVFKATVEAAGEKRLPRDVQQVKDVVEAYQFAKQNDLNKENLLEAHRILSANLLHANDQGAWRTKGVKVGNAFVTIYMPPHQSLVPRYMDELMKEVASLVQLKFSIEQAFYYAAYLHLVFAKIHPFIDGNGRCERLLEKWFLASQIGEIAWSIGSEGYYIRNLDAYYENLAAIGPDWGALQWERSVPFLLMLARSVG